MPDTPAAPEPLVTGAAQAAESAVARCGSRTVELTEIDQYRQTSQLLADVWRTADGQHPLTADILRALAYSGNYVCGAYQGNRLVGTVVPPGVARATCTHASRVWHPRDGPAVSGTPSSNPSAPGRWRVAFPRCAGPSTR
jgi:hypothetical protein